MKKRLFSILLAATLVLAIVPMEAMAANETSASMAVSYTYTSEYIVNIPASISINDNSIVTFSADKMNIGAENKLHVSIDGDTTYENGGNFYLYKDKGTANEARMACSIGLSNPSGSIGWTNIMGLSMDVATFADNNTAPLGYGAMKFTPQTTADLPYGEYTGTMKFKIKVLPK